jgi:uncharacterized membrane protein
MINQGNERTDGGSLAGDPGPAPQSGGGQARTRIPGLAGIRNMENADRIATGAAGLGLAGYGLFRRGPLGLVLGALGTFLLVQSVRQKHGASVESGIEVDQTVTIDAPVSEVWNFVRRFETWPQFMSHVQEITSTGERRHRWRVEGPAGIPTEWESEVTAEVPNERISWRAIPGSMVDTEGTLSLQNQEPGRTRLNVRMLYHPPAGAMGDVVAKIFRRDPKAELRENLQALKQKIEGDSTGTKTGSRSGRAASATAGTQGTTPRH